MASRAPGFESSREIIDLSTTAGFGRGWYDKTMTALEELGVPKFEDTGHRFYSKAVLQGMQGIPELNRVVKIVDAIVGTDLREASFADAKREIAAAGLVLRPGAERSFEGAFEKAKRDAMSFENAEHLKGYLTSMIWEATIPGVVIKPNSPKEAVLWALTHSHQVPWPHLEIALGADTAPKRRALERANDRLVAELVPEARDGRMDLPARLRNVCEAAGLCQSDTPPKILADGLARRLGR